MYGIEEKGWFFLNMDEVCRVTPEIFEDLKNLGVECVEMGGSLARLEKMIPVLKERDNIEMILHTEGDPFTDRFNSENIHIRRAAIENLKRNIDIALEINVNTIVIHPPAYCDKSIDAVRECYQYAQNNNVVMALENSAHGEIGTSKLIKFIRAIDIENIEYTFDTGHANIGGSPLKCAEMLGKKIRHVHWHDNNGEKDQHLGPGMGNIDFHPLMDFLLETDKKKEKEITLTLECDKPIVNYEETFLRTKKLRDDLIKRKG
jgi:sugar phosphate isomerase/epimerase